MKIVKLTFNYDWPIFRQTKAYSQIWGDYKFIIDENLKACDFWIIYSDYKLQPETVKCNPENTIFIPAECYATSPRFTQTFLNQFGLILTVQRELKHKNIKYTHNANPWFVGRSYDELIDVIPPNKTKLISVVTSNKVFTEGHQKRYDFVMALKKHFGDKIDLFGRGINDFEDKWDVLADYKYTVAIENDYCDDWVTEKYFDCMLSNTLPFYYGCPNLETIVDKNSFIRIDINKLEEAITVIEDAIENNEYENRLKILNNQKIKSLNNDQLFPLLTSILDDLDANLKKKKITLKINKRSKLSKKIISIKRHLSNLRHVKKTN
ncbi:glycosyltransferase family 10 domain-containing protein [Lacinutrix sp. Hel_I_90]|uniref:glycosyltransferase family 10 domain-containing protein n=1 Tax=Lacinutrix sp. Hel_I_90 TaxID=1249999 RepID=UPI0006963C13|nr:glycosyltransferase family 10 [Lacinutrix sp. Hel_I_90]